MSTKRQLDDSSNIPTKQSLYLQISFGSIVDFGEHLHLKNELLILGQQNVAFVFGGVQFGLQRL